MSEEDGLDDWAAAMAEQADEEDKTGSESEGLLGTDAEVAELEEFDEDREITPKEKRKLDTILDIPVTIAMEVGRSNISIRNLLQLNQGSVVELDRVAGEPLDVLVNGTLIAHGEVVVVNDKFGIRLTDVISQLERIKKIR
ncbi:flagellar motor switch protein FliN [Paraglaciecola psychrophila]|uniref:Flagellar motor switch protein FliN n=1 Tax=Paraglaciecola psychrophila 170 TaxID=1129794 RepID=K7ACC3_9ALTE|nr:flagellar motor switch protein FliN [Paraglaciecola psychrophila]AGH45769.1 flagellar motor switch protein [Paraglaciecola psychrophila 170]GAC38288.1 flagellar motor switch protein FliN [Paraglaciecola psychrophila 170]